ncbi:MAG: hypothetical protein RIT22_272 [Bacteroidota bacterium]|mgnify:CR=1 FL=1|jgi:hypothetical protein
MRHPLFLSYYFFLPEFIISSTAAINPKITKPKTTIIINEPFAQEYNAKFLIIKIFKMIQI